ncbi:deoxyribonuclease YcfH [Desulfocucumis palustris]|uniref:Deoxyribonuclease YcfH n=1 Tax=Desulfocucumis palustris TaxID=1898651 RepID=A0A2L2XKC4_9FIRM|nr:TatD family hydrolase [Desulfocucumis palustris]GBF34361.1 deoxyribonuclease YcfH [Desulfocucumis palustris]
MDEKDRFLVDTHAHLDIEEFDGDREEAILRARDAGVRYIINASFDLPSSERSVKLANQHPFIYALVGVHPHEAEDLPENYLARLGGLAAGPGVVAIGEIGLDYYRDLSPRPVQQKVFREQLALCRELDLPVVIHDRDAHGDLMDILKKDGISRRGGVLHCYSGSWEMAGLCMAMGFYISIAGPVTFPNAARLKDIAGKLPLERLLTETDCPYLAPQARRGKRNEPAYVRYVTEEIASLRGMETDVLAAAVLENTRAIFGIPAE